MKGKIAALLCVVLALVLSGCGYKKYTGKYPELYTVAVNSVLWTNGHSYSADRETDPAIEIIEKDEYGRTLFTYDEKYYAGAKLSFVALVIAQYSSDGFVYYYEDCNYLIKQREPYSAENINYSQEETEYLKTINDWGSEIKLEKCIKKVITDSKQKIPCDDNIIREKVTEQFNLADRKYNLFLNYLTDNDCGSFIAYGAIINSDETDVYFAVLTGEDVNNDMKFFIPENVYDYQQELNEFKAMNGWFVQQSE